MKKRLLIALLAGMMVPVMLSAQGAAKKTSDCGCSFSSINQAGMLEGSTGTAFQFQTINGMRLFNNWFAGIGVGYDRYRFRSIPLFFDLRRYLFSKPNTPFIYGDIGLNFPWPEDRDKSEWWNSNFDGGLFYDAGIGYRLGIGKKQGIIFSGGFSFKKMRERRYNITICDFPPFCTTETDRDPDTYNFKLRRFSLKAGIQL